MRIIEIKALSNGSHRSQEKTSFKFIPEGWAVVPDGMELKNLPFGDVIAQEIDGVMTVTKWVEGDEPKPYPEIDMQ